MAAMAPATLVAVVFGSWVHDRVRADRFRLAVFVFLIIASLGLVFV